MTVRIKILFITVSKTVSFKIGTVQLPKNVYLAGNGPSATRRAGTALFTGGDLFLNIGDRAGATVTARLPRRRRAATAAT